MSTETSSAGLSDWAQTTQPDGAELAAKLVSLISFSALSVLFGIKTFNVQFRYLTYSRWLVMALYVLSWAFTVISMLLVTTNNANYTSCFLSIMVCDVFYSGTKITMYFWLIEKIYVVTSSRNTRWKTMSYRFHCSLMLPYVAIFILMLIFHTSDVENTGLCIIGLQSQAAIPLIVYDFFLNLYMTVYFVRPLIKLGGAGVVNKKQSRLHEVAFRTLVASVVCLIVSFANIFSLQMLHGRERGLVCLTCCTVDVTINVITIHWVTSQTIKKRGRDSSQADRSNHKGSSQEYSLHLSKNYRAPLDDDEFIHQGLNDLHIKSNILSLPNNNAPINNNNQMYGFTNTGFQTIGHPQDLKEAPPYVPNITTTISNNNQRDITLTKDDEKFMDDHISPDSMFEVSSSIHESQSSRKSLTKN